MVKPDYAHWERNHWKMKTFMTRKEASDYRADMRLFRHPDAWDIDVVIYYNPLFIKTTGGWVYELRRKE